MKPNPRGLDTDSGVWNNAPEPHGGASLRLAWRGGNVLALALLLVGCGSPGARPAWIRPSPEAPETSGASRCREFDAYRIPTASPASFVSRTGSELGLDVLTFNIHGLPRWLGGPPRSRFAEVSQAIHDTAPDIVLLQEVWTAGARSAAPASAGWYLAQSTKSRCFFAQSGLVTASRHPLLHGEFRPFGRAAFLDALVNKGALKVTLELSRGTRVNVWNVHLQAGAASGVRASQIAELIRWVREAEDGQVLDLMGGDFNCTPDSPEYRELAAGLGTDLQRLDGRPHAPTFPHRSPRTTRGRTLDYLFWRPRVPLETARASCEIAFSAGRNDVRLSDHLPVRASLRANARRVGMASAIPAGVESAVAGVSLRRQLAPLHE